MGGPKKKKRQKRKLSLDAAALERALSQLPNLTGLESLPAAEATEVAKALLSQGDRAAAERLAMSLVDRDAVRAVKRALFLAKQQSGTERRAPPTSSTREAPMMGAPGEEARRIFTFTTQRREGLHVVEAYFCVPEGLFRLKSSPTQTDTYTNWARDMMAARDETSLALPRRVRISEALLARKRWEIADCLRHGRLGIEVDEHLVAELGSTTHKPEHPVFSLDLGHASPLTARELLSEPHSVRSFFHEGPMAELARQWDERGATALISSGSAPSAFGTSIDEWVGQWGAAPINEHLCDLGYFYAAVGRQDLAVTFRTLAAKEGDIRGHERVARFLTELMVAHFS